MNEEEKKKLIDQFVQDTKELIKKYIAFLGPESVATCILCGGQALMRLCYKDRNESLTKTINVIMDNHDGSKF